MLNNLFFVFLLGHILGDFYFQSGSLSKKKEGKILALFLHSIIYLATLLAITLGFFGFNKGYLIAASLVALSHLCIDMIKFILVKNNLKISEGNLFIADQLLHIGFLFLMASVYGSNFEEMLFVKDISVMKVIIAFLFIAKPTNIIFSKIFKIFKPIDDEETCNNMKAGSLIGILERIIIVIMVLLNEYAAIALVLTAKSLARYDKLSKDSQFAEYYLIGTLSSVIFAVGITLLLFKVN